MKYELFLKLYCEALKHEDVDMYISECGWQDWFDDYQYPEVILKQVYSLAKSDIRDLRAKLGYSRAAFSRAYNIPVRTVENWEAGIRVAPTYINPLIAYTIMDFSKNKTVKKPDLD
ncbi:hypothetical protein CBF34_06995 [Vagococcus penaei]|uniref:helix-turn-helix domain-containing protein n=1 Tax=Vagococcus penaei TaxID=633807 RepID=UPI001001CEA9|nr:helix-turn-helix domain-containing protein [Vagococcus penaei]RSU01400.1 hypothetical protein CBF34_06995 [Vagococcus penaei]